MAPICVMFSLHNTTTNICHTAMTSIIFIQQISAPLLTSPARNVDFNLKFEVNLDAYMPPLQVES